MIKIDKKIKEITIESLNKRVSIDIANWEKEIEEILFELEFENVFLSRMQIGIIVGCLRDYSKYNGNISYDIINFFEKLDIDNN